MFQHDQPPKGSLRATGFISIRGDSLTINAIYGVTRASLPESSCDTKTSEWNRSKRLSTAYCHYGGSNARNKAVLQSDLLLPKGEDNDELVEVVRQRVASGPKEVFAAVPTIDDVATAWSGLLDDLRN